MVKWTQYGNVSLYSCGRWYQVYHAGLVLVMPKSRKDCDSMSVETEATLVPPGEQAEGNVDLLSGLAPEGGASKPSDKMIRRAEGLSKRLNIAIDPAMLESFDQTKAWLDQHILMDFQIRAQKLAQDNGVAISEEHMSDIEWLKAFCDAYRPDGGGEVSEELRSSCLRYAEWLREEINATAVFANHDAARAYADYAILKLLQRKASGIAEAKGERLTNDQMSDKDFLRAYCEENKAYSQSGKPSKKMQDFSRRLAEWLKVDLDEASAFESFESCKAWNDEHFLMHMQNKAKVAAERCNVDIPDGIWNDKDALAAFCEANDGKPTDGMKSFAVNIAKAIGYNLIENGELDSYRATARFIQANKDDPRVADSPAPGFVNMAKDLAQKAEISLTPADLKSKKKLQAIVDKAKKKLGMPDKK